MKAEWEIALLSLAGYQGGPVWPTAIAGTKLALGNEMGKKTGVKSPGNWP